jgi:hypothetical protein
MTTAARPSAGRVAVTVLTGLCGLLTAALGGWALLAPQSFAGFIDFPPYNEHLLHDLGAFQIGIGAGLLLAPFWSDAVGVALVAFLTADTIHVANHALDLPLGGHRSDPWLLAGLGVAAAVALLLHLRLRTRQAPRPPGADL